MKLLKLLIVATCLGSFAAYAEGENILLPELTAPSVLSEGTERILTDSQIAEILPWAKNSKTFLTDLLDNTRDLPMSEREEQLLRGIDDVVLASAPRHTETLMRYVLNRGVVVYGVLKNEIDPHSVGAVDVRVRVLSQSIKMALSYYQNDLNLLMKKESFKPVSFAAFGITYVQFLFELNKSIFDSSAQYKVARIFLSWDLYRDLENKKYAGQILKIYQFLKILPVGEGQSDKRSLSLLRQIRKVYQRLNLKTTRVIVPPHVESKPHTDDLSEIDKIKFQGNMDMLTNTYWAVRVTGVRGISQYSGDAVTTSLVLMLADGDGDVFKAVVRALETRHLNTFHINVLFRKYLDSTSWTSRLAMVSMIAQEKTLQVYKVLNGFLKNETDGDVRDAIRAAMLKIEKAIN